MDDNQHLPAIRLQEKPPEARKCVGDAHEGWVPPAWHMIKLAASLEAGT